MLHINQSALDQMLADAERSFPDECCGFFFGTEDGEQRFVKEILVVDNSKEGDKRRRFEISPRDYLRAEAFAEEKGLLLLGVYHSHPNSPAIPSAQDRMAAQPYFSYIIISVFDGEFSHIRSWQLNENQQFEVESINNQLFIHQIK
jgi:proteasome lid subunit RPN8/RPN11